MKNKALFNKINENNYYGHAYILNKYCKLSKARRINGHLQHGWTTGPGIYGDLDNICKNDNYYVWTTGKQVRCKELGFENVYDIGAPFIYINSEEFSSIPFRENSLLIFPSHSCETEYIKDTVSSYKAYFDMLIRDIVKDLKASQITVCLYWYEFRDKRILDLCKRYGFQVITLGHRDKNIYFLFDFIKLVNKFEYITSTGLNTAIFYSLYLNKKAFIAPFNFEYKYASPQPYRKYYISDLYYEKLYQELLFKNFQGDTYKDMASQELGTDSKKSPEEFLELFEWNKPSKMFLFSKYEKTKLKCEKTTLYRELLELKQQQQEKSKNFCYHSIYYKLFRNNILRGNYNFSIVFLRRSIFYKKEIISILFYIIFCVSKKFVNKILTLKTKLFNY